MPSLAGTRLDKYEVVNEVGHGGMAVVYLGRDTVLEREVAVKVLHAHLADREESRQRLRREALAVAKLRHENILEIFDYSGPEADESYIVTEFIHGPTLKEWMDENHEPRPVIAAMVVHRLCQALCQAHRTGIIHRDIKPENVMIRTEDGCLKLMDFGIAQILDNQKLTLTGQLLGSPAYMAPELISGKPLDARTDLFSLGILLYQLSTATLPFSGRNPHEVLNRIADGEYPPPASVCPLVDGDLEAIIRRALSVTPDDRYQSAETMAKELEAYLAEVGLEPSNEEIAAYFNEPDRYVELLDERVSTALMTQAEQAIKEGYHSRAIRMLARVLELDPENASAKGMLNRLRTRERRIRQVLVLGAGLGAAGLIAAGFMLLAPEPDAVQLPPDPNPVMAQNGRPSKTHIPSRPPDPKPNPTVEPSTETGEPTKEAKSPDQDAGTKRKPRPRQPTLAKVRCKIRLEGVPATTVRNLNIQVTGQAPRRVKGVADSFMLGGQNAEVSIKGTRYSAQTQVTREECNAGVIPIPVSAKPARVQFKNEPQGFTVECVSGCPKNGKKYNAANFPSIPVPGNQREVVVKVIYRAKDYRNKEKTLHLTPGTNRERVKLDPH